MTRRPRRVGVYYAWNRPEETRAPLGVIENRFPTLFESRRMLYPRYAELADPDRFDQGIGGFLDHIMRRNFVAFVEQVGEATGAPVLEVERVDGEGRLTPITRGFVAELDTLLVISFDSKPTAQGVEAEEVTVLRDFLSTPETLLVIAPHHDIGDTPEAEFAHHGDPTIPPEQRFGGFARTILAGLGVPVENRFGLRPASGPDLEPAGILIDHDADRLGLLDGVAAFNLHPHLPHFQPGEEASGKLDVLARQRIDPTAPPHPFTAGGRSTFDALLQSRPGVFAGELLIGDATLWSSTAGGVHNLQRLWTNVVSR